MTSNQTSLILSCPPSAGPTPKRTAYAGADYGHLCMAILVETIDEASLGDTQIRQLALAPRNTKHTGCRPPIHRHDLVAVDLHPRYSQLDARDAIADHVGIAQRYA